MLPPVRGKLTPESATIAFRMTPRQRRRGRIGQVSTQLYVGYRNFSRLALVVIHNDCTAFPCAEHRIQLAIREQAIFERGAIELRTVVDLAHALLPKLSIQGCDPIGQLHSRQLQALSTSRSERSSVANNEKRFKQEIKYSRSRPLPDAG